MANQFCGYIWKGDSSKHFIYRDADGHVHELWSSQSRSSRWEDGDLNRAATAENGDRKGLAPNAASQLAGYAWEGNSSQHIDYRGADGHIHELWGSVKHNKWSGWKYFDVTQDAKAPNAAGEPCSYAWEQDSSQHIIYRSADGHIHELWGREVNGRWSGWQHVDLTRMAGAPLAAGNPAGYIWDGDASHHVVYRGTDGHVHALWRRIDGSGQEEWSHVDLTMEAGGIPVSASDPMGYVWEGDSSQHIVYRGVDGHIHELWRRIDGSGWEKWLHVDLTLEADGSPESAGDPMGYAWEGDSTQHVIYRGADGNVHKLWGRMGTDFPGWQHVNLTAETGALPASSDPVGYVWENDSTHHVIHHCENGDIQELWCNSTDDSAWKKRRIA